MRRFLLTIGLCVFSLLPAGAEAQATRPTFPAQRPQPTQPNPAVNPPGAPVQQPAPQQPAIQQPAPQQPAIQQPAIQQPAPTTPPAPPTVTYRDGLLTVQALNSTLGSVLTAIRNKTGIEFDGYENAPDRVALSLGPSPSGEVLQAIFAGSRFDFVAVGRPDNPAIVQRVIMTPKSQPGGAVAQEQQPKPQQNGEGDDEDTPDEQVNGGDPQDTPVQPIQGPQVQTQTPPQQQPKTPEQLLQDLQDMKKKQDQQQQQGDQNPAQAPRKPPQQ